MSDKVSNREVKPKAIKADLSPKAILSEGHREAALLTQSAITYRVPGQTKAPEEIDLKSPIGKEIEHEVGAHRHCYSTHIPRFCVLSRSLLLRAQDIHRGFKAQVAVKAISQIAPHPPHEQLLLCVYIYQTQVGDSGPHLKAPLIPAKPTLL